ncbi:carbamoyltransferase family protein [Saccharothrix variisporea]|uniref:Carbamoyltransferase n=1 Tax=Saccharothrix variisporea TaxID=543527 RepID=A0A495XP47_9PSEU|nr:carbamoyltransferase C-terminal domain-containing protein [Saccharothrix variisporea]RKT74674.1 carbamoyltransferase [Saccharothrix variisporea]
MSEAGGVPEVVLGYSGFDGTAEFKRAHFPDLTDGEARLCQGLDAAAALLVDGRLVAAVQQERYSGLKYDHAFPADAIRACLSIAGLSITDVDQVRHGFDYGLAKVLSLGDERSRRRYDEVYRPERQTALLHRHFPELSGLDVRPVRHHDAHALTAAVPSGFEEALVVVVDGMGELHAVTVYRWAGGTLTRLAALDFRSSLGLFYSVMTMHLGYWPNSDEYKVMAMAASGDAERFAGTMREAVVLRADGRFDIPLLQRNHDPVSKETFAGSRRWLAEQGCPPADGEIGQVHFDLAAAGQRRLEEALFHLVGHWVARTGLRRVAFAGGVALNCVAIGKLAASDLVDGVYVQPAAGDEGTAVGAALLGADLPRAAEHYPVSTFLGPDVDSDRVPAHSYFTVEVDDVEAVAARLLAKGLVVGWAQGRLEFGPRALGNRSILADPRRRETRDRVNAAVKFREGFRPLAPIVKAECATRYFRIPAGTNMRHMTIAVPVRPERADEIAAVVHDDGTARVQVVHAAEQPRLWRVLDEFERLTGVGTLINTSLNVKGQPTARSASEAFRTFDESRLDVLVVGGVVHAKEWAVSDVLAATARTPAPAA